MEHEIITNYKTSNSNTYRYMIQYIPPMDSGIISQVCLIWHQLLLRRPQVLYNGWNPSQTVNNPTDEIHKPQPNGEGTGPGPVSASDRLMLPIPQIMQPGVARAENLAPQRSQTSYPIVDRRLRVAAQNWEGSSRGSIDLLERPL